MNPLADVTENEWPRIFRCTETMSGWNYDGSSKHKPHMVSDLFNERTYWIEFWEKITGRKRKDTSCSYEGCTNGLLVGGHIWLSKQAGSPYKWCFIAPICQTCNNKRLEPDRELGSGSHLKKGTLVVRIRKPEDETEVNTDEILSGMNKLKVDTEPPAPPHCASNSYFEKPSGVFTIGTTDPLHKSSTFRRAVRPTPTFEKPPGEKSTAEDAGTEVDILRRDLDDLRNDFDKVRRKLGKTLGIGLRTKEEEFEDIKRPRSNGFGGSPTLFTQMTFQNYRAWKSDFEKNYREQQKQREKETEGDEEQQIAKDRLEAELQRVIKVEREAENKAKLKAYSEAEADAKAQKKHFLETGEFISKSE